MSIQTLAPPLDITWTRMAFSRDMVDTNFGDFIPDQAAEDPSDVMIREDGRGARNVPIMSSRGAYGQARSVGKHWLPRSWNP